MREHVDTVRRKLLEFLEHGQRQRPEQKQEKNQGAALVALR
jgi:hypothetical protein